MFGQPALNASNPNNDTVVPNSPSDGVSSLTFSASSQFLVASSWASTVSCWETQVAEGMGSAQVNVAPRAQITVAAPALCTSMSADSQNVFVGLGDGTAQMWTLGQPQAQTFGKHDAPIRSIHFVPALSCVFTGSWDKTIKCWDVRQPTPTASVQLPERCYSMDVAHPLMVVATAERKLCVYDLSNANWQRPYRVEDSPLKHQTRCVRCFPDREGFAIGSIEGRVAIHHVDAKDAHKNFAFKCHRDTQDGRAGQASTCNIYAVNDIAFHNLGTFATAGSDGVFNFWDKDSKQRLMAFKRADRPISCAAFSPAGTLYAYALSYDWSRGSESHTPSDPNTIMLHKVQKDEITQRNKKPGRK